jgi:hypothetical protein
MAFLASRPLAVAHVERLEVVHEEAHWVDADSRLPVVHEFEVVEGVRHDPHVSQVTAVAVDTYWEDSLLLLLQRQPPRQSFVES